MRRRVFWVVGFSCSPYLLFSAMGHRPIADTGTAKSSGYALATREAGGWFLVPFATPVASPPHPDYAALVRLPVLALSCGVWSAGLPLPLPLFHMEGIGKLF
jgi:hypothetical protein